MKNIFCAVLTQYRLYQGLVLYHTLDLYCKDLNLAILCVDHPTYRVFKKLNLKHATLISIDELETPFLKKIREERKLNEYCWTLKPIFIEYLMRNFKDIQRFTYVDADLCFYSDPTPIFESQPNCSILLSKHNYSKNLAHAANLCGNYNSGFISFKKDPSGIWAVNWWKNQCIKWCYHRFESNKFGDQKYLDALPHLCMYVCDIHTRGVNIGFWNHKDYWIHEENGQMCINHSPLIFYHFASVYVLNEKQLIFKDGFNSQLAHPLYESYMVFLRAEIGNVKNIDPNYRKYFMDSKSLNRLTVYTFTGKEMSH